MREHFQQLKYGSDHESDGYQTNVCSAVPRGQFMSFSLCSSSHTEELTNLLHILVIESAKPQREIEPDMEPSTDVSSLSFTTKASVTLITGKTNGHVFFFVINILKCHNQYMCFYKIGEIIF